MIDIADLNINVDFPKSNSYEAVHAAVISLKCAEHEYLDVFNAFHQAGKVCKAEEVYQDLRVLALIRWNLEIHEMNLKKKEAER